MLHLRLVASAAPLFLIGALAGSEISVTSQPCISLGPTAVKLGYSPWAHQKHVSFTTDRSSATVRVQLVDSPELADFAVADDAALSGDEVSDASSCSLSETVETVSISAHAAATDPVIYLSNEPNADYRIYVDSSAITAKEVAAMVVSAAALHGKQASL